MLKDLLLIIDSPARAEPIIRAARGLAERLSATLTIEILGVGPVLVPAFGPVAAAYLPEVLPGEDHAERIAVVTEMVAGSSTTVRVVGLHDDPSLLAERTAKGGPIADLILIGDATLWTLGWLRTHVAEAIVMGSGTPLIVLNKTAALGPVHHAMIGWKDIAETRRALHDLVALVAPHARIAVVSAGAGDTAPPVVADSMAEVVRHLRAHGFDATAHAIPTDGRSAADALQDHAQAMGVELLAVGAFGHARWREVVFGGVTRTLIDSPAVPVLLSR